DVECRAKALIMLAQHEAVEGDRKKALAMARESFRLLQGVGGEQAAAVQKILADLEVWNQEGSSGSWRLLAELNGLMRRAEAAGPEGGRAAIAAALDEARRLGEPAGEVVALLARSGACWEAGDVAGCDESLLWAEEALGRVDAEDRSTVAKLVEMVR